MSVSIRRATDDDDPAVTALLRRTLEAGDGPRYDEFLDWKHRQNPFGRSYEWVATIGDEIVGYRSFLRWRFVVQGRTLSAVRAVDTATHPAHQGKGIFRTLTMTAVEAMTADAVDFVFNTPNDQSRPGYLKMGWRMLGPVPVHVRPSLPPRPRRLLAARSGAASLFGIAAEGFPAVDPSALDLPIDTDRISTDKTPEFLAWRYGLESLGYRMAIADGAQAVFRLRDRGQAREATFSEVAGDGAAALVASVLRRTRADLATLPASVRSRLAVPVTKLGPTLCVRDLSSTAPDRLGELSLSIGDIELF